ncbi:M48 family metalloprotease [Bradyrhizobium sp. CCBAU 53421]|uniref:M48 family metalloprotease n=1 Tax=Bradyrhizobium sp. CCBAU 53421 TaxID=1325120 RepID=UPI001889C480|nr:M48 family metalloprotease [Bradyrhizobium sp. CCBAU 53421]
MLAQELQLLAMPKVGNYRDQDMNALAEGSRRWKAIVSFSQDYVEQAISRKLMAIAAHEVAHIANNDIRRTQYAWSFKDALTRYMLFERALAFTRWTVSWAAELPVLKQPRKREFWADAAAAALLGRESVIETRRGLDGDPVEPPPFQARLCKVDDPPKSKGLGRAGSSGASLSHTAAIGLRPIHPLRTGLKFCRTSHSACGFPARGSIQRHVVEFFSSDSRQALVQE